MRAPGCNAIVQLPETALTPCVTDSPHHQTDSAEYKRLRGSGEPSHCSVLGTPRVAALELLLSPVAPGKEPFPSLSEPLRFQALRRRPFAAMESLRLRYLFVAGLAPADRLLPSNPDPAPPRAVTAVTHAHRHRSLPTPGRVPE